MALNKQYKQQKNFSDLPFSMKVEVEENVLFLQVLHTSRNIQHANPWRLMGWDLHIPIGDINLYCVDIFCVCILFRSSLWDISLLDETISQFLSRNPEKRVSSRKYHQECPIMHSYLYSLRKRIDFFYSIAMLLS